MMCTIGAGGPLQNQPVRALVQHPGQQLRGFPIIRQPRQVGSNGKLLQLEPQRLLAAPALWDQESGVVYADGAGHQHLRLDILGLGIHRPDGFHRVAVVEDADLVFLLFLGQHPVALAGGVVEVLGAAGDLFAGQLLLAVLHGDLALFGVYAVDVDRLDRFFALLAVRHLVHGDIEGRHAQVARVHQRHGDVLEAAVGDRRRLGDGGPHLRDGPEKLGQAAQHHGRGKFLFIPRWDLVGNDGEIAGAGAHEDEVLHHSIVDVDGRVSVSGRNPCRIAWQRELGEHRGVGHGVGGHAVGHRPHAPLVLVLLIRVRQGGYPVDVGRFAHVGQPELSVGNVQVVFVPGDGEGDAAGLAQDGLQV